MSNKIFIDSSILVEYSKNRRSILFEYLLSENTRYEMLVSEIVMSEYTFHWLAEKGQKAPLTMKRDKAIPRIMLEGDVKEFLSLFTVISNDNNLRYTFTNLMQRYNLLPNDALILGTCLNHGIKTIASFDADFAEACQNEGITLVSEIEQLILITPTQKS